jgi:TonB family protein
MKTMRLTALISLLVAATAASAETREFTYNVDTAVDAGGVVTSADEVAEIDPAFEATVVGLMKQWRFKPALRAGQPVATRTAMWVKVVAEIGDDQAARISARYLSHGNLISNRRPPVYPPSALRSRSEAEVVLEASFDADGAVTTIEPFQIKVSGGDKRLGEQFYAAAHDAVRGWSVRPEVVDGQPVASRVLIPLKFTLQPSRGGALKSTLDRSTESLDAATRAALDNLVIGEQRTTSIGNASGLELLSDTSRS